MPKHFIKKYLPNHDALKHHKSLQIFGSILHSPNLWHLNRRCVARAAFIGLFACFLPIPFQMILAAALAIFFEANLPISVVLVWISNPFTMPPIFYFAYKVGALILQRPALAIPDDITKTWLIEVLMKAWLPLYLGAFVSGIVAGALGYWLTRLAWRCWVARQLEKRKRR